MLPYVPVWLNDGLGDLIASGLFVLAFGLMIYATLRLRSSAVDRFASIPLSDRVEDPRDGR